MIRCLILIALIVVTNRAFAQGYVCAEGGGNANKGTWTDEVFGWMVEKGKRGHVVVMGALEVDPEDTRHQIFTRLGAVSASNIKVEMDNADSQEIYDEISRASVVWIKGGDQSRYTNWWRGTKTEQAIREVFARGGVIGGTSAGCAILGEVTYDARVGGLSPRDALRDARHKDLTLTADFLGLAPGVLFDTHFTERGRIGRLPVMLAHAREDLKREVIGMGVDPRTAVCLGPDGIAEIKGEGTVTILEWTPESTYSIEAGRPPRVTGLKYTQLPPGAAYDTRARRVIRRGGEEGVEIKGVDSRESHHAGRLVIPIRIDGSSEHDSIAPVPLKVPPFGPAGETAETIAAAHRIFYACRAWVRDDKWTVLATVVKQVSAGPEWIGLLLDEGGVVGVGDGGGPPDEHEALLGVPEEAVASALIIDARGGTGGSPEGERVVHLENARLHMLPPGWALHIRSGKAIPTTPATPEK